MGSPLAPVSAGQFFVPSQQSAQGSKNDPSQLPPLLRQSDSRKTRDTSFHHSRAADDEAGNGAESSGLYEISASVVLQLQLFSIATGGATDAQSGTNGAASAADSGQAAGSSSNSDAAAPVINNSVPSGASSAPSAISSAGVTGGTSASSSAAIPTSATLKQEEAQLQQALQGLGLSPAAIQQFTYESQMLAQLAPGLFQEFLSYVLQLAQAAEPSVPSATAASVNAAAAQSAAASTPPSSSAHATSQPSITLEFGSVQVTQAELSITPGQNGGETVSFEAQSATADFASLQAGSSSSSPSTTSTSPSTLPATNPSSSSTQATASA